MFSCVLFWFGNQAWSYSYMQGNPRWEFRNMPIPWYVSLSQSSSWNGRSAETLERMAKKAFAVWEDIDCSFMMFRYMGTTETGALKGDGKNVIEWVVALPDDPGPNAIGLGGPIFSNGKIHEGNVWIKAAQRSDDFFTIVIAHEVGHAIGLGHTDVPNSIMYPTSSNNTKLTQDDREGLCKAYPISTNTCSETAHCPKGLVCNGGRCIKCQNDGQCGSEHYCDRELCVPLCRTDEDCSPKGRLCITGRCKGCLEDNDCGTGRFCDNELCHNKCQIDQDCQANQICKENGRCIARGDCQTNRDCKAGEHCFESKCVGRGKLGLICQGVNQCDQGQDCVIHDCRKDLDCLEGHSCKLEAGAGVCTNETTAKNASICTIKCDTQTPCPGGFLCKPFSPTLSFCYPEARQPPPPKNGDKDPDVDQPDPSGCGCAITPAATQSVPTWVAILFGGFSLLIAYRRRP
jgi:hypothetical protein